MLTYSWSVSTTLCEWRHLGLAETSLWSQSLGVVAKGTGQDPKNGKIESDGAGEGEGEGEREIAK